MTKNKLQELTHELSQSQNICSWLELYSYFTWHKIGFVRKRQFLRITETSITQDLAFQLYLLSLSQTLPVKLYESKLENTNGNDLEIFIETPQGYVIFPTQAKIIHSNHKYSSIAHKVGGRYQIDLLLNYAKKIKGIPLYLMYNTCLDSKMYKRVADISGYNIESFGCSIASAKVVKQEFQVNSVQDKWKIPNFADIHCSIAYPLSLLACSFSNLSKENFINASLLYFNHRDQINFYSTEQINDDPLWENVIQVPEIGKLNPNENVRQKNYDQIFNFNPKFRIVFSQKITDGKKGLWALS